MKEVFDSLLPRLQAMPGQTSLYAKDLTTGETCAYREELPLVAASVIKLPILVEAFRQERDGLLSMDEKFCIRPEDKLPSCGALTYLHDGLEVTLRDLCTLMIILSDNTATNLLIRRLGMDAINRTIHSLGLQETALRRKLFDASASGKGIQNTVSARDMGALLERIFRGQCVSPAADGQMLKILSNQRLNGKMPFFLHDYAIAHKTGEDDGITHDVGVVLGDHPMVLCFLANETNVPQFERFIQDAAAAFVFSAEKE